MTAEFFYHSRNHDPLSEDGTLAPKFRERWGCRGTCSRTEWTKHRASRLFLLEILCYNVMGKQLHHTLALTLGGTGPISVPESINPTSGLMVSPFSDQGDFNIEF